jgi:ribonucleoside-diphosphate reductase alpha chain
MAIAEIAPQSVPLASRPGLRLVRHFTREGVHPYDEIEWERRDASIPGEGGNVFEQKGVEVPKFWSMTATNVVASKYFRGKLTSPDREWSVKQMVDRVVDTITRWGVEGGYFSTEGDAEIFNHELKYLMVHQHASFNSPVWFNIGVAGVPQQASACQPYRARVSTPFGLKQIGEIVEQNLVGLPVYDARGLTLVTAVKRNGRKRVYRVELANGSFVEATGDHLVSVAASYNDKNPRWMRVDELATGMRLRLVTNNVAVMAGQRVAVLAAAELIVGKAALATVGSEKTAQFEDFVTLRLAEGDLDVSEAALAGWLQGDGFVGQYSEGTNKSLTIEFEVANDDERSWVLSHLDVVFPNVHRHEATHPTLPDYRKIRLYGEVLRPFVTKYGLLNRRDAIRVPARIWEAHPSVVIAYLRSVFQADGYVSLRQSPEATTHRTGGLRSDNSALVEVATISRDWMEDVHLLLMSRGIYSRFSRKPEKRADREDLWVVSIRYLSERAKFAEEIGFIGEDKRRELAQSLEFFGKRPSGERAESIVAIRDLGDEDVYDIQTMSGEYLSNNVVVHNCFILSVDDDMHSILDWFTNEGMIFKGGSGSGINVSRIRSSREQLSGGGYASGPVSFMRGADSVAGSIKSGGTTRRAAKMVVLDSDHPDVREFIWCKAKEEQKAWALGEMGYDMSLNGEAWQSIQFQNANNSVRATDEFMEHALADQDWALTSRTDGTALETVKARALLHEISEAAWQCGDPGMQFDTTINEWHTNPVSGRINGSNPCSEYMSIDDSACNLASLNLMRFLHSDGEFDAERFARAVDVVFTAQEILVGFSDYPTAAITANAKSHRQLGLGYANLGALLMHRGLAYDSNEGRAYSASITALMTGEAYAQSARLAGVVGPYDAYPKNKSAHDHVIDKHRAAAYRIIDDLVPPSLLSAARQAWDDAVAIGKTNGYRNAQATVLAPTGTISFMMDCDTTGVEPDIALVKYKRLVGGGMLKLVNGTVPAALRRLGYTESEAGAITSYIEQQGTIEGAPALRDEHLAVFDCAFKPQNGTRSISHMGHIKMMGAVQPFISGAISKTVNLPETATVDDVMEAYVESWKHGVKAIAVYRDGSKKVQPVSTNADASNTKKKVEVVEKIVEVDRPRRRRLPDTRGSLTHKFSIEGHEGYITVGLFEDASPGELFVTMAKEGSTLSGMMDAFATSVSLLFQYGVPLVHMVDKFGHMRFEPSGWTGNPEIGMAKSIVDYVFRWLGYRFLTASEREMLGLVRHSELADATPQLELIKPYLTQTVEPSPEMTSTARPETGPGAMRLNSTPDAPPCPRCGWLTVRNGTCHKCENCGETTGCS